MTEYIGRTVFRTGTSGSAKEDVEGKPGRVGRSDYLVVTQTVRTQIADKRQLAFARVDN